MGYVTISDRADGSRDMFDHGRTSCAALRCVELDHLHPLHIRSVCLHDGRPVMFNRNGRVLRRDRYDASTPSYMLAIRRRRHAGAEGAL